VQLVSSGSERARSPAYDEAMSAETADQQVIACNYTEPTSVAAAGALAYVVPQLGGNLPESVRVLVRSRGGRWVEKWERTGRLDNFRLKTLPPEHPRYGDDRLWPTATVSETDVISLRLCKAQVTREKVRRLLASAERPA
jgi:hypothetical protein